MKRRWPVVMVCLLGLPRHVAAQHLTNSIPESIATGDLRIGIDHLVPMPATLSTAGNNDHSGNARGRSYFLRESPDGRLFVNDLGWATPHARRTATFAGADGNGEGTIDDDDDKIWRARFGSASPHGGRLPFRAVAALDGCGKTVAVVRGERWTKAPFSNIMQLAGR